MKRKIKIIVFLSFTVLVAGILAVLFLSPLCIIKNVDVSEAYGCTETEKEKAKEMFSGNNAFFVMGFFGKNLRDAENQFKFENPYIKTIEISYSFPDTVIVKSTPSFGSFMTEYCGQYLYIDSDGTVLEVFTERTKTDCPLVLGVNAVNVKTGMNAFDSKNENADSAIRLCSLIRSYGLSEYGIDVVDVSDPDNIWIYFAPSLSVKFGSTENGEQKVKMLRGILEKGYDGTSNGTVDFTLGSNPVFKSNEITEKEQENPAESDKNQ